MTISRSGTLTALTTVSVAPTTTTVVSWDRTQLGSSKRLTVYLANLDGSQTFVGQVERRQQSGTTWAVSTLGDFASVVAGTAVMVDLDVEGSDEVRIRGTMSGAGGDVQVGATRKAATP